MRWPRALVAILKGQSVSRIRRMSPYLKACPTASSGYAACRPGTPRTARREIANLLADPAAARLLVLLVCALIGVGHDPFRLFIGYVIGVAGTFAERLVEVLLGVKPEARPLVQFARRLSYVAQILIPARRRPRRSTRPAPNQPAVVGGGLTGDPLWMPGLNRGGLGQGERG
jgi:hypothetical protein